MSVPRSEMFDDVYFSQSGGMDETRHVFLNGNHLEQRMQAQSRFAIGETGFGTGLNFLMAWELFDRIAPKGAFLDYVSVEKYPLSQDEIRKGLSSWRELLDPRLEKMLGQYPARIPGFHRMVFDGRVALTLIFDDANDALPEIVGRVDAWFLDGFTPAKNPDMWTQKVFDSIAALSNDGASFSTFTAAGFVKRGLEQAGFDVLKQKGFGKKRDMLSGVLKKTGATAKEFQNKKIVINGAGLAGTSCAHVLKQYGFNPVLVDPNGVANGASGNEIGLINPRFSAFRDGASDFYAAAFAQTLRNFSHIPDVDYKACGSLHLITNADKEARFSRTVQNWGWGDNQMALLDVQSASDVAGVSLSHSALYLPQSAQISPQKICGYYAANVLFFNTPRDGDIVIHANGAPLMGDYIHTVRGQVSIVESNEQSTKLKTNLCYGGYISAPQNGRHAVGSTFQKWLSHTNILPEDDEANLQKLTQTVDGLGNFKIIGHRAGLRIAAKDHFPVVGRMAENEYVTTAHGSHGILSSLLGAHILADYIRGGIFCVGKSTLNMLAPFRGKKA